MDLKLAPLTEKVILHVCHVPSCRPHTSTKEWPDIHCSHIHEIIATIYGIGSINVSDEVYMYVHKPRCQPT